jgi:hypothetical protein
MIKARLASVAIITSATSKFSRDLTEIEKKNKPYTLTSKDPSILTVLTLHDNFKTF